MPSRPADDLLTGFTEPGARKEELRAYLTTTVVASLYVFDAAFHFGAYHAVNFHLLRAGPVRRGSRHRSRVADRLHALPLRG
jgi:hypothetical protein